MDTILLEYREEIFMKKEHIRISVDLSKELDEKVRKQADKQDMTINALIRLALEYYLKKIEVAE